MQTIVLRFFLISPFAGHIRFAPDLRTHPLKFRGSFGLLRSFGSAAKERKLKNGSFVFFAFSCGYYSFVLFS